MLEDLKAHISQSFTQIRGLGINLNNKIDEETLSGSKDDKNDKASEIDKKKFNKDQDDEANN